MTPHLRPFVLLLALITLLGPWPPPALAEPDGGTVFTSDVALAAAATRATRFPLNRLAHRELIAAAEATQQADGRGEGRHFVWESGPLVLAFAYRLTGEAQYAELAARVLKERTLAEPPRLQNRVDYSLPAGNEVLMRGQRTTFRAQTFALLQTYDGPGWGAADKERVRDWLGTFGRDLRDGFAPGSCITNAKWFHLEAIAAAGAVSQDQDLLDFAFERYRRYLDEAICGGVRVLGADGTFAHEMRRFDAAGDNTWYYAGYSMLAMVRLAEIARNQGVNLYDYATPDGRSLKQALDAHVQYFTGTPWPHEGGEVSFPAFHHEFFQAYELGYAYWQDEDYLKVLRRVSERRRVQEMTDCLGPAAYLYANSNSTAGGAPEPPPGPTPPPPGPTPPPPGPTPPPEAKVVYETWAEVQTPTNARLEDLKGDPRYPARPSSLGALPSLNAPFHLAEDQTAQSFGSRMRTLLVPPASGTYELFLSADDTAELLLSPDSRPEGAHRVAFVARWVHQDDFTCARSQDESCHQNSGRSQPIPLVAGQAYYLEVNHLESIGEDHVTVAWRRPGSATIERIAPAFLRLPESSRVVYETWAEVQTPTNARLEDLKGDPRYPAQPTTLDALPELDAPFHLAEDQTAQSFGSRMRTLLVPPASGTYELFLSADDTAELLLSPDGRPEGAHRVAFVARWVFPRDFLCERSQAESCGQNSGRSQPIPLVAGQAYYLEVNHLESVGEDHVTVAWRRPGSATIEPIDTAFLRLPPAE